jgi:hypothetical protein
MSSLRHSLFVAIAVAALCSSADLAAQKLYRWVDKDGTVRYGDQVPPDAVDQQRETLNRHGMAVDRVDRALTDEERVAQQAMLAEQARLAREKEEQDKLDAILLTSYQSEADLERTYRERFALVEQSLESARIGIRSQEKSLVDLLGHAANLERTGKKVEPKLAQSIALSRKQVVQQRNYLERREADRSALQQEYDDTLARYRVLTGRAAD